jgi:hypothetical protein
MTETKHTPGPWRVAYNGTYGPFIESCDTRHPEYGTAHHDWGLAKAAIAAAYGSNAVANAKLIASAPDQAARIAELEKQLDQLLEAAYSIQNLQGVCWAGSNLPAYEGLDVQYHWDKLRAAIKACEEG